MLDDMASNNRSHELTWNEYDNEDELDNEFRDNVGDGIVDGHLTSLEEEVLIGSLLDSEDIGPAVRAVYERGAQTSLLSSLDGIVDQKDEEILGLCGQESALDFIRSVEAIVSIRDHARQVGDSIVSVNDELQSEGRELLAAQEEVKRLGVAVRNIDNSYEALAELQGALQLICTIKATVVACWLPLIPCLQRFLDQKKLLRALKTFQQLQASSENMQAPSFSRLLERQLPIQAEKMRTSCLMEFNKWISQLRMLAQPVGKAAMQAMQESSVLEDEALQLANRNTQAAQVDGEEPGSIPRLSLAAMSSSARSSGLIDFRKVGVDMGSLLQCLHIFRELGQLPSLRSHFRDTRRSHARIDHLPPKDFVLDISGLFRPFLEKILGFFVLEDAVSTASNGVFPRAQSDYEWAGCALLLSSSISQECSRVRESATFVELRALLHLVCGSLDKCGYSTRALRASLESVRPLYIKLLLVLLAEEESREDARRVIENDSHDPLRVESPTDYERLVVDHQLTHFEMSSEESKASKKFKTVTMSFSRSVPRLLQICKNLAFDLSSFTDQAASDPLETFLREVLSEEMTRPLHPYIEAGAAMRGGQKVPINLALQICVNTEVVSQSCEQLMSYVGSLYLHLAPSEKSAVAGIKTIQQRVERSSEAFQRARSGAEDLLFSAVMAKVVDGRGSADVADWGQVNEIMDRGVAEFDWAPSSMKQMDQPSDYILDLVAYLQALHYKAFNAIAQRLYQQPLSSSVKKIFFNAFQKLDKDLHALEAFAIESKVSGLKDCFAPLRQLVNLLVAPSILPILDEVDLVMKKMRDLV
ncbi:Sec15 protein [Guillardia theta CCMP2712]|uniref:Sec15 protein n=1 Tax=Guillardia theta (strain CCMP2712) TaxID=905079 RepID=L1IVC9_GUITC|nr:Sec15 protein [Guillardia theta CCMP2712]EKX39770.1 Sec15 protein [Guillardia theta CCMP2712]|eukprot:XP_005826750.1 Sec15 protein [Guillardia theta CCMP2712]